LYYFAGFVGEIFSLPLQEINNFEKKEGVNSECYCTIISATSRFQFIIKWYLYASNKGNDKVAKRLK
jgi:hypothetical protein